MFGASFPFNSLQKKNFEGGGGGVGGPKILHAEFLRVLFFAPDKEGQSSACAVLGYLISVRGIRDWKGGWRFMKSWVSGF